MPNEDLGEEKVLWIIRNLTDIIKQVFPCECEVKNGHERGKHTSIGSFFLMMESRCILYPTATKVYSALGNHDYHPKSQLPAEPNNIYDQVAKMWQDWLKPESQEVFKKGG